MSSFFNIKYNIVLFLEISKSSPRGEEVSPEYLGGPNTGKLLLLSKTTIFFRGVFQLWEKAHSEKTTVENNRVTLYRYKTG